MEAWQKRAKLIAELGAALDRKDFYKVQEINDRLDSIGEIEHIDKHRPKVVRKLNILFEAMIRNNEAIVFREAEDYPRAAKSFALVVRLVGDDIRDKQSRDLAVGAYCGWGACLGSMGRFSEAIQRFDDALRLSPNDPSILHMRKATVEFAKKAKGV
jgi:tetratricopeptide (TPR) repeat protein